MLRIKQIAATIAVLALPLHLVGQAAAAAGKRSKHAKHLTAGGTAGKQAKPSVRKPEKRGGSQSPAPVVLAPSAQPGSKRHFRLGLSAPVRARAARDPSDTISDYKFAPGTLTIHVGDTVTWTNNGPTSHTATADNHSFDTGILARGQSASHTFAQAGTIPYFCTLHPFMHGTIVVLAAVTSTHTTTTTGSNNATTAGSNGASTSDSSTTSTSNSSSGLPNTGLNLALTLLVAIGLIALGVGLRRGRRTSA